MAYRRHYNPVIAEKEHYNESFRENVAPPKYREKVENLPVPIHKSMTKSSKKLSLFSLPKKLKVDDIVLLAVIYLLLTQDEKDFPMILALGFLFISEYVDIDDLLSNIL